MTFDDLKKLKQRTHREQLGFFLIEGEHLVLELGRALARRPELSSARILISHEYAERGLPEGLPSELAIDVLNARQMSQLSETRSPQGILAVVPLLPCPPPSKGERAIYLHQIQDPGNLGTILRTLAWFGGFRCLLSPDSVDPYNAKAVRASMGALFHVSVEADVTLAEVSKRYSRLALLDMQGRSIACDEFRDFDCYLFGSEARGVTTDMRSIVGPSAFSVPGGQGPGGVAVESLNLATTVNLCLYELMGRSN